MAKIEAKEQEKHWAEFSYNVAGAEKINLAEQTVESALKSSTIWWHGSVSGDLRGGLTGLHIGTKEAAKQALEASIGIPADGRGWTGDREYSKTLLAGRKTLKKLDPRGHNVTGFNVDVPDEDFYPTVELKYGDGSKVPMSSRPRVEAFKIIGPMTNTPYTAYDDWKANGYMRANKKKGTAKRGYFYKNIAEDEGSISATVPNGDHLEPVKASSSESIEQNAQNLYNTHFKSKLNEQAEPILSAMLENQPYIGMQYSIKDWQKAFPNARLLTLGKPLIRYGHEIKDFKDLNRKLKDNVNLEHITYALVHNQAVAPFTELTRYEDTQIVFSSYINKALIPSQSIFIDNEDVLDDVQFVGVKKSNRTLYPISGVFQSGFFIKLKHQLTIYGREGDIHV
jgi:hypothetical protein